MAKWCSIVFVCLVMAGCRFLEISDEQVQSIATAAGAAAQTAVTTAGDVVTPGAGAGLGAVAGLAIAGLTKVILGALQKKKPTV